MNNKKSGISPIFCFIFNLRSLELCILGGDELLHKGQDVFHSVEVEVADVVSGYAVLRAESCIIHIKSDKIGICGVKAYDPLIVAVFRKVTHCVCIINVGKSGCGNLTGMICDGAKPSCAAKIAMAVEAGFMGWEMAKSGREFFGGDGIVTKGVENTIRNVGQLARDGMMETDREIIRIMLGKN